MSRNPYFAHLPTWRNRQDLAYAIDSLPSILETLTASSPLLATYSYPSTSSTSPSSSSSSSSSHSSFSSSPCSSYSSSSSITTSSSSLPSSTPSSYSSPLPSSISSSNSSSNSSAGALSPAKSKASAFKERFVLDLAKECHRSLSRSPSPSITTFNNTSRDVSGPIQPYQQQQQQQQQPQQYQDQANKNGPSPYYPLQFSTRARAMAYLIEILQSLQKEPCGCDLVRGCYCGTDGIEDHEGKSPCYVCGEWYLDRRESSRGGGGGGYEGDMDCMTGAGGGARQQRQGGKAWHEQGSLRHHVAEAKVKKWLDSVWKPPLTPATTPEQETVKQFGLRKSQEDHRHCSDHLQYPHQNQHRQQQHARMMEPGRPWSVHDIEIEARAKSRSRNNSASSINSMSFAPSPSSAHYYPPIVTSTSISYSPASPQQDLSGSAYGYASSSGSWHFNTSSPSSSSYLKPNQATPPSQRAGPLFWSPQPAPTGSRGFLSYDIDSSQQGYQSRVRTMSCSDAPLPSGSTPSFFACSSSSSASLRASTPPVLRSNSIHTSHINSSFISSGSDRGGRSKPVRASTTNSTFTIPQEILDPNYKSPTFRIKSWNPASSSSTSHSPAAAAAAASSFGPIATRLSFADPQLEMKKQSLDEWTSSPAQPATVVALSPASSLLSSRQESVLKSSKMGGSDQEDSMPVLSPNAGGGQQGNTRDGLSPISPSKGFLNLATATPAAVPAGAGAEVEVEVKKSAPFQLNFTSSRFRAAVQAKASMDNSKSSAKAADVAVQQIEARRESVQKSVAFPDNDDDKDKEEEEEEEVFAPPRHLIPTLVVSQNNTSEDRKKIIVPALVDVVIITDEVVGMCDPDDTVAGATATTKGTTANIPSMTTSTSSSSMHSLLLIQKSAPMTSPTTIAASITASSSSSSSAASTSASASASASACASACASTSLIFSPDLQSPKSPKKDIGKSNASGDVQRASSWSSLQKVIQTIPVSATAGPSSSSSLAAVTPALAQGSSMLHIEATSLSY